MRSIALLVTVGILAQGCASTQLNHNTLELASTTDHLMTAQILHNLSVFLDNPAAVPSQVVIGSGTATTSNSVTPNLTNPLTSALTITSTIASTIGGNTTTTNQNQSVRAAKSLGISANDLWSQNWAYDPITEPDPLRRLSALYRYAIDNNEAALIADYPLVKKTMTRQREVCMTQATGLPPGSDERRSNGECTKKLGSDTATVEIVDEHFVTEPQCVVCIRGTKKYINPRLASRLGWLRWEPLPGATPRRLNPPRPGDLPLSPRPYRNYKLYIDAAQAAKFNEFVIAVSGVTAGSTASGTSGQGSGSRSKTQALPLLQVIPQ